MEYLVKQKNSAVFKELLTQKGVEYKEVKGSEAVILPYTNSTKDRMLRVISLYLMASLFEKTMEEIQSKGSLDVLEEGGASEEFINTMIAEFFKESYFFDTTYLRVCNYLESNSSIHVESFHRFNMRGFKDDLEDYVSEAIRIELSNAMLRELDEMFEDFRKEIMGEGFDVQSYTTVVVDASKTQMNSHVYYLQHKETKELVLVDAKFIETVLKNNQLLQMRLADDDLDRDFSSLPNVLKLFPIEKIVVKPDVYIEVVEFLSFVLEILYLDDVYLDYQHV